MARGQFSELDVGIQSHLVVVCTCDGGDTL